MCILVKERVAKVYLLLKDSTMSTRLPLNMCLYPFELQFARVQNPPKYIHRDWTI